MRRFVWILLTGTLLFVATPGRTAVDLQVTPQEIAVNTFYHSTDLLVRITVPESLNFVLQFTGENQTISYRKKGRKGIFWLSVGDIEIQQAPAAYMVFSNITRTELHRLLDDGNFPFGERFLKQQIHLLGATEDSARILDDFFRLKKQSGLYVFFPNPLEAKGERSGEATYELTVTLPSKLPLGQYKVHLFPFSEGRAGDPVSQTVTVRKSGFVLAISNMAHEHAATYGILAIVVAIVTGFVIGLVFNLLKKKR